MNFLQRNFYILTAAMLLSVFMANDSFLPAMPLMAQYFQVKIATLQLGVGLFILGSFFIYLLVGPLSDKYGRKFLLVAGGLVYLLGSLACILSVNITMFLIARIFQGLAVCTTITCSISAINEFYEDHLAIRAMSISTNITMIAPALGPIFGATVLAIFPEKWRLIFVFNALIGLVAWILIIKYMPETHSKEKQHKGSIFHLFKRLPEILKDRVFTAYAFMMSSTSFVVLIWITSAPIMLMINLKESQQTYSLYQIPVFGAIMLANSIVPLLSKRFGSLTLMRSIHKLTPLATLLLALVFFLLGHKSYGIVIGVSLATFVNSLGRPLKVQYIIARTTHKGTASGILNQLIAFGPLAGSLAARYLGDFDNKYTLIAIVVTMGLVSSLGLIGDYVDRRT